MALYIKSEREIEGIRGAGRIAAAVLREVEAEVRPGRRLKELEQFCVERIRKAGAEPTFLGYRGFPAGACVSVNEEVVHGIPNGRRLAEGDIVKIDVGVTLNGLIADAARTYEVGRVSPEVHDLVQATEEAFVSGMEQARPGRRVSDIGHAVQVCVEARGYSVVRELHGHGVGVELWEEPTVFNFGPPGKGLTLQPGMTIAIEPMVNMGGHEVVTLANGWTVVARDGKPAAHYENTVLVTDGEPEVLTQDG